MSNIHRISRKYRKLSKQNNKNKQNKNAKHTFRIYSPSIRSNVKINNSMQLLSNKINKYIRTYTQYLKRHKTFHNSNVQPKFIQLDPSKIIRDKSIDHLKSVSDKALQQVVQHTYSLVPYFIQPNNNIQNQEENAIKMNSGNCIAFATMISKMLAQNDIAHSFIPATILPRIIQPGFPYYGHSVIMVETPEHYILHEPAYFISDAIIVNKDGTPFTVYMHIYKTNWNMQYNSHDNKIYVSETDLSGKTTPQFHYNLSIVTNPIESISFPVNINNKRIPIVKYSLSKKCIEGQLSIRLDNRQLEGFSLDHISDNNSFNLEDKGWFPRFDWTDCLNPENTLHENYNVLSKWEGLSDEHCRLLGYKPDDLRAIVFAIINANKIP